MDSIWIRWAQPLPGCVLLREANSTQDAIDLATGKGRFTASIDDQNQIISYELSYEGLEGETTIQAHIHFAQRSVNGAIHAFLCGGGGKPACPAIEGTVIGESPQLMYSPRSLTGESKPEPSRSS